MAGNLSIARAPGELIQTGLGGLQLLDLSTPTVDSRRMSARARICTPLRDRQGDVIEPSGVGTEHYQHAPSVMFEHGFSGIPFPIAKSETPDGRLAVEYDATADALYARAFFSDRVEASYQIFGLIEEGLLRATSIHVHPREGGYVEYPNGTHITESDLLEWSWCTIGVNPEAYAKSVVGARLFEAASLQHERANKILARGTIGNSRLLPSLAKCLRAVEPPRKVRRYRPKSWAWGV